MKSFKGVLTAIAVAASLLVTAPANATLMNWFVDTDGAAGAAGKVLVTDFLDLTGAAYVRNTFAAMSPNFTFQEFGTFDILSTDGGPSAGGDLLTPALSAQLIATGTGSLLGGNLNFNAGSTLNIFSGMTQIASLSLTVGNAVLNTGTVLPNGDVSLIFQATSVAAGYFFDDNMVDISTIFATNPVVLGFATTNVIPRTANVFAPLVTGFNNNFGTSLGTVTPNGLTDLFLGNNGQFRVQIPEPGSLALLGIGILGLALGSRRRKQA